MSKWIEALPCISFTVKERKIARKHGFLSYPEFLDNFYISEENRSNIPKFLKHLCRNKNLVIFAVYPDNRHDLEDFHRNYDFCEWIYPLHKKSEIDFVRRNDFEWVALPHDTERRDYIESWFIDTCDIYGFKKWYLGFWAEDYPEILHHFDGLDSTLPETYSGKYGKLWFTWRKYSKRHNLSTLQLLNHNVQAFRTALDVLSMKTQTLVPYVKTGGSG